MLSSLETKAHTRRMYSLDNVFDAEEWQGFLKRLDNAQEGLEHAFWCDPKMDGLALELVYENGRFVEALTRGDGEVGELVTEAMQTVRNLPKVLHGDAPERLEVRGEVIFRRRDFALLNERLRKENLKTFANPRNAAAGWIPRLPRPVRCGFWRMGLGTSGSVGYSRGVRMRRSWDGYVTLGSRRRPEAASAGVPKKWKLITLR